MSVPKPDHSHATMTSVEAQGSEVARQLQTIRSARKKLTAEQVTYVREAVLCDHRTVASVCADIYPPISESALWGVVRGRTYQHVPLSRRLKIAYRSALDKRKVPVHFENLLPEDATE